jgi:uncharacterized protein (DUF2147 family)
MNAGFAKALLAAATLFISLPAAADPVGLWRDKDGTTIRVQHCGPALCGSIVSMASANDPETGQRWTDKHNPDPARRLRALIGVQVFIAIRRTGPGKWSGRLYNTDDGMTVNGNLIDSGPAVLRVEGCVGSLCGGEDLKRVGR